MASPVKQDGSSVEYYTSTDYPMKMLVDSKVDKTTGDKTVTNLKIEITTDVDVTKTKNSLDKSVVILVLTSSQLDNFVSILEESKKIRDGVYG